MIVIIHDGVGWRATNQGGGRLSRASSVTREDAFQAASQGSTTHSLGERYLPSSAYMSSQMLVIG